MPFDSTNVLTSGHHILSVSMAHEVELMQFSDWDRTIHNRGYALKNKNQAKIAALSYSYSLPAHSMNFTIFFPN